MFKKILLILSALILIGYLVFTITYLNPKVGNDLICKKVDVEVVDSLNRSYLTTQEVMDILIQNELNPIDKKMSYIKTDDIKNLLEKNRLIKKTECFKTIDGSIRIKIYQRIPILRLFSSETSYYVDSEGEKFPIPRNFSAYVPVASGSFNNEKFDHEKLYEFALFLAENKFWNSQIEQIHIAPNLDVELIPRVGNHHIVLGDINNYKENLEKLKLFYDKGLNKIGWNRYSIINLKYKNQVVCTKVR